MAEFNRATLRKVFEDAGMEIPPKDVLGQICDLHTAKTDEMKDTVKELTKRAEKAEQERDALEAQGNDGYKEKFEKEHSDFEKFKADVAAKETRESKGKAFLSILNLANIKGANADFVMDSKTAEKMIDELEIKDGKVVNQEDVVKAVTEKWGNYAERKEVFNAPVPNPPINTGGTAKTKADIYAKDDKGRYILSTEERQRALVESHKT